MNKKLLYAFLTLCAVDLVLALLFQSALIMIIGCICAGILVSSAHKLKYTQGETIILAYVLDCIVMIIVYYGYIDAYGSPYYLGGSDDLDFEFFSAQYAEQNNLNYFSMMDELTYRYNRSVGNGFIYLFALIRVIFEPIAPYHTIVFRMINVHLLLICALLLTVLCRKRQNGYENSKLVQKESILFLSVALYPNVVYVSVHVFRDILCLLILCCVIYDVLCSKKNKLFHIIILSFLMYLIRPDYLIVIVGTYVFSNYALQKKKWVKRLILLMGGIGILIIGIQFNIIELIKNKFNAYSDSYLTSGDGIGSFIFALPLFPIGLIARVLYAFVTPLPYLIFNFSFEIEGLMSAYRALGTCFFIYLLPYYLIKLKKMDTMAILSLAYLVIISSMTFTFRHFVIFHPLAIAVAYTEMIRTKHKTQYTLVSTAILIFFFVAMAIRALT